MAAAQDSRQVRKLAFLQVPTNINSFILFTYLDLASFVADVSHPQGECFCWYRFSSSALPGNWQAEKFSLSQSMKHPEIRSLRQSTVIMQNPRLHPALPLCSCYCSCTISVEQILAFANRNKIRVSPKIMLQGTQETTQKR